MLKRAARNRNKAKALVPGTEFNTLRRAKKAAFDFVMQMRDAVTHSVIKKDNGKFSFVPGTVYQIGSALLVLGHDVVDEVIVLK